MFGKVFLSALADSPIKVEDFINKIFPNGFLGILSQLLAFGVLVFAITFFAYKPVKKILNERASYVEKNIKEAEEANRLANEHEQVAASNIMKSKKEAQGIVQQAKDDGVKVKEQILLEAKELANVEKEKTAREIELAKQKANDEIREEIIQVALQASKQVVGRELNNEDNDRLVDDFIKDIKR